MAGHDAVRLDFVTVDVFTDTPFVGNPLAVVFVPAALRARIDQPTKQRIAREFNLSETVFLHTLDSEPDGSATTREIDIFTVDKELPFAGHPTIGSAYLVLHHLGWSHVDTLQTKAGPIRIEPLRDQDQGRGRGRGRVRAAIPHAVHIHQQTLGSILEPPSGSPAGAGAGAADVIRQGLSADPDIRAAELAAPVVSIVRGMTFVLVRLPSLEHLARVTPARPLDFGRLPELLDRGEWHDSFVSRYYYVPRGQEEEEAADGGRRRCVWKIRARMVEPAFEDPATGSAACTLASYLAIESEAVGGARFEIAQGVEMGRPSDIVVDALAHRDEESGDVKIKELFLGGTAVVVMNGSIAV
ncbi:hypothetical protein VTH06DRAFT_4717 [Thermothelomyces fergusii]